MWGFGRALPERFEKTYRAYPVSFIERPDLEFGDKIVMPPSALELLAQLEVEYPMLFEIENRREGKKSHCGVIEFIADEGMVYLPYWMMQNLFLGEGSIVTLRNVSLPKGKYVKLQPHSKDFLDISDHKAVLERSLRNYSCLTVGDTILIHYNNKRFHIDIMDAKPKNAICVIETDCEVDFAPPLDYVEPVRPPPQAAAPSIAAGPSSAPAFNTRNPAAGAASAAAAQPEEPPKPSFQAFTGSGRRLDGKPGPSGPTSSSGATPSNATPPPPSSQPAAQEGAKPGKMVFGTRVDSKLDDVAHRRPLASGSTAVPGPSAPPPAAPKKEEEKKDEGPKFQAFSGKGYKLSG